MNRTQFWSGAADHCALPGCESAAVAVTVPLVVTAASQTGDPYPDLNLYVFEGESYTGYTGVSDQNGQMVFTLPEGEYRFRADYNGVQFWSDEINHCVLPGCTEATVEIPGGLGTSEVTIDYSYDALNRLTAADYDDGTFFHYSYDEVGNRLTQETLAGTNTYVYDIANRLTSVDGVNYAWDNNGNLLSDGTSTYTYNYANMLAGVNQAGVVYDYPYNGLEDRLQQAVDGVPTNYTLDINTGLTQVLADGMNTYLYGNGRIAQEGAGVEYFLGDALGSVRQLVDSTAQVTLTQSYEPYGSVMASEGEGESVFQHAEEMTDGNSLTYLRSRYYSAGLGSFTSKDEWDGYDSIPMSYNYWLYVYGNPIRYTDPTGEFAFGTLLLLGAAGGTLGGLSYYSIRYLAKADPCTQWDWGEAGFWMGAGALLGFGGAAATGVAIACVSNPICLAKVFAVWNTLDYIDDRAVEFRAVQGDPNAVAEYYAMVATGMNSTPFEGPWNFAHSLLRGTDFNWEDLLKNANHLGDDSIRILRVLNPKTRYIDAVQYGTVNVAMIGRYNEFNPEKSYEVIAKSKGFMHLDLEDFKIFTNHFQKSWRDVWWDTVNVPFLDEVASSKMDVYLSITSKAEIAKGTMLYEEVE